MDPLKSASAKAAALVALVFALAPLTSVAQDLQRHGEVTATEGQEVTVRLGEDLSVSSGTAGTIYTTTTVGGEERPVRVAQVKVSATGSRTVTAQVTQQTQSPETGFAVSFETVRRQGTLVVNAELSSADITIDGEQVGSGSVRRRLAPGEHVVGAAAEGHQSARRVLQIEAGQTREVSFDLKQATGKLVVVAVPDSARIQVDGRAVGRGSILKSVSSGQHEISVRADDYAPFDTTVNVRSGRRTRVRAELSQKTGRIDVVTQPAGAEVFVRKTEEDNSERIGKAPLEGYRLKPGRYVVTAQKGAFSASGQKVEIVAGEPKAVQLRLEVSMEVGWTSPSPNAEDNGDFGNSLAALGDINGDGTPDLAVGADGEEVGSKGGAGRVYIVSGATGEVLQTLSSPNAELRGLFGGALAKLGDVNGDGTPDLAVGAEREDVGGVLGVGSKDGAGRVYIVSGATGEVLQAVSSPNAESVGNFGGALAKLGDVNGDGTPDLAVGADWETVGAMDEAGRAYIVSGATGKMLRTLSSPKPEENGGFGSSLAKFGDINGDGTPDLAVGAEGETVDGMSRAGQVYIVSGATGEVLRTLSSPKPEEDGYFGISLVALGDINGDGTPDLAVGAGWETVGAMDNAGRAYIVSGATGKVLRSLSSPNAEEDGYFGESFARLGDANGDGTPEFAVGAEGGAVGGTEDAGQVHVFTFSP